jgi:hypothetical protein
MTDQSDTDPLNVHFDEEDMTSPDYLLRMKRVGIIMSREQFNELGDADTESDTISQFMLENGLKFGDSIIVGLEDGTSVIMTTEKNDFGTVDRDATEALSKLVSDTTAESIEKSPEHSQQAFDGIKDMGEKVVGQTFEVAPELTSQSKEFDDKDRHFLQGEIVGMVDTATDFKKQYPLDVDGHEMQATLLKRMDYYAELADKKQLSKKALNLLTANFIGASTDIGVVRRNLESALTDAGQLNEEEIERVKDYAARIDREVRSNPNTHPDIILNIISSLQNESHNRGKKTTMGLTMSAMAGGLATQLSDRKMATSVTSSVWQSQISSI